MWVYALAAEFPNCFLAGTSYGCSPTNKSAHEHFAGMRCRQFSLLQPKRKEAVAVSFTKKSVHETKVALAEPNLTICLALGQPPLECATGKGFYR